jgi:membrane protein implicated in regulation of membrane protease activity
VVRGNGELYCRHRPNSISNKSVSDVLLSSGKTRDKHQAPVELRAMLALYLATLLLGTGALVLQLAVGHDSDAAGAHDLAHDAGGHDIAPWSVVASLRFWSFALFSFGAVGAALRVFGLAGVGATAAIASVAGVASGFFAVTVIRRMVQKTSSSHATAGDVLGKVGRVVVPVEAGARGKVRVLVKGSYVDYVASATERLAEGEDVVVCEIEEGEVTVSRAPKELKS